MNSRERPGFPGSVGFQQRVLPAYRSVFIDRLAEECGGGLSLIAGAPRATETILTTDQLGVARYAAARNIHLFRGVAYLCVQGGLLAWLRRWDPDVLILEANPRYISNSAALRWMQRRGKPVIGWGLGAPPIRGGFSFPQDRIRRRFLNRLDALIAYSTRGAAEYEAQGVPRSRIFVAPNAVTATPGPPPTREAFSHRSPRLLFVGRLQARKRVDLLLKVCRELVPKPEVWIVGDGPERQALEELAGRDYPQARFTGALQGEALREQYAGADLLVMPGTGGLAVQEGMAYGLPVIVGEGDGTQEDLVRPDNGWLVPPGDGEGLLMALRQAFSDPQRLLTMGAASHRSAAERFNTDVMADTFVHVMNRVTGWEN
ncbi:MAG TPA: glycosyltransferase family 4 protein [Anaerolineales bacterium]|nr:glycosyltransferase family 4 protein [Anaerolineales bacterium]